MLLSTYPVTRVALEDVAFNHVKQRWGTHFSTVEIGKAAVRAFIEERGAEVVRYRGYDTQALRVGYGYKKSSSKSVDRFEAHCSDALSLALTLGVDRRLDPGSFVVADDRYRAVRRRLHVAQPAKDGVRARYSRGTVKGLHKGVLIGKPNGKSGQLCGETNGAYRYYDHDGKRQSTTTIAWVNTHLFMKKGVGPHSSPA